MGNKLDTTIHSEMIEPTAAYLIGRWWAQCEEVKDDPFKLHRKCQNFWFGVRALNKLSVTCAAPHFSIAMSNNMRHAAAYIKEMVGVDPILDKDPQFPL